MEGEYAFRVLVEEGRLTEGPIFRHALLAAEVPLAREVAEVGIERTGGREWERARRMGGRGGGRPRIVGGDAQGTRVGGVGGGIRISARRVSSVALVGVGVFISAGVKAERVGGVGVVAPRGRARAGGVAKNMAAA